MGEQNWLFITFCHSSFQILFYPLLFSPSLRSQASKNLRRAVFALSSTFTNYIPLTYILHQSVLKLDAEEIWHQTVSMGVRCTFSGRGKALTRKRSAILLILEETPGFVFKRINRIDTGWCKRGKVARYLGGRLRDDVLHRSHDVLLH